MIGRMGTGLRDDAISTLRQLIQMYFPDPNPDIFTLDSYLGRYKLRIPLTEPAIRDIEKSQRIHRRLGNYIHAGLSAFHIGLIYLYSQKEDRGARQQFTEARKNWSFAAEANGLALAYFAEGIAYHLAMHYEDAMAYYHKASQALLRIRLALSFDNRFVEALTNDIVKFQELLRSQLWTEDVKESDMSSIQICDHCSWFKVIKHNPRFLTQIQLNMLLLVNFNTAAYLYTTEDLVVVQRQGIEDAISLENVSHYSEHSYYLARPLFSGALVSNSQMFALSPQYSNVSIQLHEISGVVTGFELIV